MLCVMLSSFAQRADKFPASPTERHLQVAFHEQHHGNRNLAGCSKGGLLKSEGRSDELLQPPYSTA